MRGEIHMKKGVKFIGGLLLTVGLLAGCSETASTEPTEEELTQTKETYIEDAEAHISETKDLFILFGNQNRKAGSNLHLTRSDVWIEDTVDVLLELEDKVADVRAMESAPEGLEDAEEYMNQGADELEFVLENYPDAIDNMDSALTAECAEKIGESLTYFEKAEEELEFAEGL
jgi:hypothetical protein